VGGARKVAIDSPIVIHESREKRGGRRSVEPIPFFRRVSITGEEKQEAFFMAGRLCKSVFSPDTEEGEEIIGFAFSPHVHTLQGGKKKEKRERSGT